VAWVPPAAEKAGGAAGAVRVAYAVGRKVGGSVVRNRVRRRLRAVCAEARLPAGDYLVAASAEAADLRFSELRSFVMAAFEALR
jgi:ribonuclease P protein component